MHNIMQQRASVSTDKGPLTHTSDCEFHYIVETTFCSTVERFSHITTCRDVLLEYHRAVVPFC